MSLYRRLSICFFLSGASGLIYEVAWVRILAQSYGQTVYAVGVVLTAFMTGLSLGSYILGKAMDKRQNLLFWYAAMEAGIAFYALISVFLLKKAPLLYIEMLSAASSSWAPFGYQLFVKYTLTILLLLPATFLMGGTLPILSKILIGGDAELEGKLGIIYAINTLGGALGAILAGFFLIHLAGLKVTILTGVAFNLSIAIYVLCLHWRMQNKLITEQDWELPTTHVSSIPETSVSSLVLISLMLSGCSAMIYEVAWNRLLVSIIGSTTYSLGLILIGVLLGIGLGSMAVSHISKRKPLDLSHFAIIQLFLGATCIVPILMFSYLPTAMYMGIQISGGDFALILFFKFLIVLSLVLTPMIFFGTSFPIIGAVYRRGYMHRGNDIGSLYAINTAGAIIGTVLVSFWLLPSYGSTISIKIAALVNILTGILAFMALGRRTLALAAIVVAFIPLLPFNISPWMMDTGVAIYGHLDNYDPKAKSSTLFLKEGLNSNISVSAYTTGHLAMKTNGKADAGISADMSTQLALGYVPMLLHPGPRDALVIGLGIGVTLRAISEFGDMERIDCVEIEPAVLEAMEYFAVAHHGVLADPRVNLTLDDARKYMLLTRQEYDIIISSPSNPWISGIANLFTKEFYQTALSKLKQGGLFAQWMQLYGIEPVDLRMIIATMADVFPELSVWQINSSDLLIIGSRGPVDVLDMEAVQRRLEAYKSPRGGDLRAYINISRPIDLSSLFLFGTAEARLLSEGSIVITDDRPEIEFHAPISMHSMEKQWENIEMLYPLIRPPHISGYGTPSETEAEFYHLKARYNLHLRTAVMDYIDTALRYDPENADYLALKAAQLYQAGSSTGAREMLHRALAAEPDNPEANYQMGRLLSRSEDTLEQSLRYLDKAIAYSPDNFRYCAEAGVVNYRLGRYQEALGLFRKTTAMPHTIKKSMEISGDTGLVYEYLGEAELARKSYQEPLAINPYYLQSLKNLGMLYLRIGKIHEACNMMNFALEVAPPKEQLDIERFVLMNCNRL